MRKRRVPQNGGKRKQRFSNQTKRITLISVVVIVVFVVCFLLLAPIFNIENIVCDGNYRISDETIIETSVIELDNNIFLTNLKIPKNRITQELEYVEKCDIKRILPKTIKITIVEREPAAYFSSGDFLIVTDTSGRVVESVTNPSDVSQIINAKITSEEDEGEEEEEEQSEPEETYNPIWGYDDDGDPIYKVNGGHYEFDEHGNRFFVDDSAPTDSPDEEDEELIGSEWTDKPSDEGQKLARTENGTIIYNAPIVYGVEISKSELDTKIQSSDSMKLSSVIDAIKSLSGAKLISKTTKFDVSNTNDIKFWVEDRLEIWFGTFENFDYKANFVASVIENSLSPYEESILDYRDSKLYVRTTDKTPLREMNPSSSPKKEKEDTENESRDEYDSEKRLSSSPTPSSARTVSNAEETGVSPTTKPTSSPDGVSSSTTPMPKPTRDSQDSIRLDD